MTKTPEQEADELVEYFMGALLTDGCDIDREICRSYSIDTSILHVERLIEVLETVKDNSLLPSTATFKTITHYHQVLEILKSKK